MGVLEGGGWERDGSVMREEGRRGRKVGEGWELEREEGGKGILVSACSVFDFKVHGVGKGYTMHCHNIEKSPLP